MVFGNKKSEIEEIKETISDIRKNIENLTSTVTAKSDNHVVKRLTDQLSALQETFVMFEFHNKPKYDEKINKLEENIDQIKQNHSVDVEDVMMLQRNVNDKFQQIDSKNKNIEDNSISRDEFNRLKNRMERVIGAEIVGERLDKLHSVFETEELDELNWKCKTVNLLKGGLAPMAEEDLTAETMREKELQLSDEEIAFYDIISMGKEYVKTDKMARQIAIDVVTYLKNNLKIDWLNQEQVKASIKMGIRKILLRSEFPVDEIEKLIPVIMEQTANNYGDIEFKN